MTTISSVDRPDDVTGTFTARYRGRPLSVSGPHRIYPSGLWYFRSFDADDAPTWIPASHLTGTTAPSDAVASVTARDRLSASTLPVIATGLGIVGTACATVSTAFRATFAPRSLDR